MAETIQQCKSELCCTDYFQHIFNESSTIITNTFPSLWGHIWYPDPSSHCSFRPSGCKKSAAATFPATAVAHRSAPGRPVGLQSFQQLLGRRLDSGHFVSGTHGSTVESNHTESFYINIVRFISRSWSCIVESYLILFINCQWDKPEFI